MSVEQTLLPCPFCGGEAIDETFVIEAQVRCAVCRAKVVRKHGPNDEAGHEAAITAWNTRFEVSLPPSAPVDRDAAELAGRMRVMANALDKQGDKNAAYFMRKGAEALALPPSGIAEMVREMCAAKAEEYPSNEYADIAVVRGIASAIRSLDLSNKGVG